MADSHLTPGDRLHALQNHPLASADFTTTPIAAATVSNIGELVDLIFEEMYWFMERGKMSKKSVIAASTATKMWRECGVKYIFRRQVLGNKRQLEKLAAMGQYEGGKFWEWCRSLVWNGRYSCWQEDGEEGKWYEKEDIFQKFSYINCDKITDLRIFGAIGGGTETHLVDLVRRMPAIKWVNFRGTHMNAVPQMLVMLQVVPTVTTVNAVDWRADRFVGYGKAEQVQVRSNAMAGFFNGRILDPSAIQSFGLHFVSYQHSTECEIGLTRLKHLEELTIRMSVNMQYPIISPPTSLRTVTVTAFTKTWCWSGIEYLTSWLETPLQWAGLEILRLQMTPMQNFGYGSLAAVKESKPWVLLAECLQDMERFPLLHTLEVVLIMEGTSLFDWEEPQEVCDKRLVEQMREVEEVIWDEVDLRTYLTVKVDISLTPF